MSFRCVHNMFSFSCKTIAIYYRKMDTNKYELSKSPKTNTQPGTGS